VAALNNMGLAGATSSVDPAEMTKNENALIEIALGWTS
jgi:hypothetical protein